MEEANERQETSLECDDEKKGKSITLAGHLPIFIEYSLQHSRPSHFPNPHKQSHIIQEKLRTSESLEQRGDPGCAHHS